MAMVTVARSFLLSLLEDLSGDITNDVKAGMVNNIQTVLDNNTSECEKASSSSAPAKQSAKWYFCVACNADFKNKLSHIQSYHKRILISAQWRYYCQRCTGNWGQPQHYTRHLAKCAPAKDSGFETGMEPIMFRVRPPFTMPLLESYAVQPLTEILFKKAFASSFHTPTTAHWPHWASLPQAMITCDENSARPDTSDDTTMQLA